MTKHVGTCSLLKYIFRKTWICQRAKDTHTIMKTSWHGNAFHIYGHLCGKPSVTVGFPDKRPVRGALMIFVECFAWWTNNRITGDVKPHDAHGKSLLNGIVKSLEHFSIPASEDCREAMNLLVQAVKWLNRNGRLHETNYPKIVSNGAIVKV